MSLIGIGAILAGGAAAYTATQSGRGGASVQQANTLLPEQQFLLKSLLGVTEGQLGITSTADPEGQAQRGHVIEGQLLGAGADPFQFQGNRVAGLSPLIQQALSQIPQFTQQSGDTLQGLLNPSFNTGQAPGEQSALNRLTQQQPLPGLGQQGQNTLSNLLGGQFGGPNAQATIQGLLGAQGGGGINPQAQVGINSLFNTQGPGGLGQAGQGGIASLFNTQPGIGLGGEGGAALSNVFNPQGSPQLGAGGQPAINRLLNPGQGPGLGQPGQGAIAQLLGGGQVGSQESTAISDLLGSNSQSGLDALFGRGQTSFGTE